jgi:hypothetical protein
LRSHSSAATAIPIGLRHPVQGKSPAIHVAKIDFCKNKSALEDIWTDDLENFTKQACSFFVEGVSRTFEETEKMLQGVGEQVQMLADELIKEGERQ